MSRSSTPQETAAAPRAVTRLEGWQKVTGQARYTSDVSMPGQLYAGILRSPHASARVRSLDTSAVRELAGVRDIITADLEEAENIRWYDEDVPTFGGRLRFVGDEVAAVAADSEEAVLDALRAFRVDYEELEAVVGLDRARASGGPTVHEGRRDNLVADPVVHERGDVEAALASSDIVVEAEYTTGTALHNAMEPHGCNARWDGEHLDLWVSTQAVFTVREAVAEKLGLPLSHVRVHAEHVGGGFGAKQVDWKPTVIAALLARRTGRPVRLMLDREEENLAAGNRNATRQRVRLGATKDGRLRAIDARIDIDGGAYRLGGENSMVGGCYQKLYACENVRTEQRQYYTNTGPSVAFRAPGFVEGTFALEQAMDELACRLDIDPFRLRERNYAEEDQAAGKPFSSPAALRHCYAAARQAFGWPDDRGAASERHGSGRKRRGIGMAASIWLAGGSNPPAYAEVSIQPDGSVTLHTGTQDIGTGTRTVLGQIAAQTLGVPPGRVRVLIGDTATELHSPTSAGSATLPTLGPAVKDAAAQVRRQLLETAGSQLDADPDDLDISEGCVHHTTDGERRLSLSELAGSLPPGSLRGRGATTSKPSDRSLTTFAAQCAEVEVDLDTAEVTVLRLVCAPDCGAIVNRLLADSQVIGGVTQGLGFAMSECRVTDDGGQVMNANLEDYLVPTMKDVPSIIHAAVDLPDTAENGMGIKGLGEPPMIATAPAIANALHDAIGIRVRDLPLNRRSVLDALAEAGGRP